MNAGFLSAEELAKVRFHHLGSNVKIAKNVCIVGAENIWIDDNVQIDWSSFVYAAKGSTLRFRGYNHIGAFCLISAVADVTFERFAGVSSGVRIYTSSDDYSGGALTNPTVPAQYKSVTTAPVNLGRHTIVGAGTTLLPGCIVGEGTAIGAHSVVGKTLDPWSIYAGVPAKRIRSRKADLLALEEMLMQSSKT